MQLSARSMTVICAFGFAIDCLRWEFQCNLASAMGFMQALYVLPRWTRQDALPRVVLLRTERQRCTRSRSLTVFLASSRLRPSRWSCSFLPGQSEPSGAITAAPVTMVAVRESPHVRRSPDKNVSQWPPKSPFQALLSSPSGRKKWRDHQNRRDPSPSPVKRTQASPAALQARAHSSLSSANQDEDNADEEDEETLQLQLAEIQAKLRLKKLQKSRPGNGQKHAGLGRPFGPSSVTNGKKNHMNLKLGLLRNPNKDNVALSRPTSSHATSSPRKTNTGTWTRLSSGTPEVEVPVSPAKDRNLPKEQSSPARMRLGISTAPTASCTSLKRARDGTQIMQNAIHRPSGRKEADSSNLKPSFSDRLRKSRVESQGRQTKQERIRKARSTGFGTLGSEGLDGSSARPQFQRPLVNEVTRSPAPRHIESTSCGSDPEESGKSSTVRARSPKKAVPLDGARSSAVHHEGGSRHARCQSIEKQSTRSSAAHLPNDMDGEGTPGFDPYSSTHLRKRHITHPHVARVMQDKDLYTLPRLLKEIKAPHYDPPDCENDFVVFAILASKSSPYDQKAAHRTSDEQKPQEDAEKPRNKFMVFRLCDLKWEVDCFLFGTAFDQFWKLTPGTLLAILNPGIMPPKGNQDTGRFSLKLGSSEDCVMEIGVARDLSYCASIKKDGQPCGSWVDKRSTEICEFHLNVMIDRERKHRMEVNTMWRGTGSGESRKGNSWCKGTRNHQPSATTSGARSHREYGQLYSVPSSFTKSTATLLDAEDRASLSEEASRKRIAEKQRERDLAKKLGQMGNGVGAEYLRVTPSVNSIADQKGEPTRSGKGNSGTDEHRPYFDKPKATDLGLLGKKATEQRLSPAKDRKRHFGVGAISSTGANAMGWGGARQSGLLQPREKDPAASARKTSASRERSTDGRLSPKKKARFVLEKGIREPGRESLGQELGAVGADGAGDGDELDIV